LEADKSLSFRGLKFTGVLNPSKLPPPSARQFSMRLSVVISTYNQPQWLEKVIWGYIAQSYQDFELVIADDGSRDDTRQMIERMQRETDLPIKHVWHEDVGFRKCTILNRAIEQADSDYLVFSDGDCIPRRDFLAVHAQNATPGYFLSGGYFKLPMAISQAIRVDDILHRRATDPVWLRSHGMPRRWKMTKLSAGPRFGWLLDQLTTTKASWNGHNSSGWKADIVRVNGFDERMEWGAEDREMGERLINCGIRGKRIRYRAVCVHLDHARKYVREAAIERNRQIRRETRENHSKWTSFGIVKQHQLARAA
jgi:glycosyltransferase involved in cell wall biosynthesis